MSEKVFPDGVKVNAPPEKAPAFVKAKIGINVSKFGQWLVANANERGYVDLDILESREGNLYLCLSRVKQGKDVLTRESSGEQMPRATGRPQGVVSLGEAAKPVMDDEIPF